MPVFRLEEEIYFPLPQLAEPEGLLAVGGDLSPERLLTAYANGIFPWYNEGEPILWWSPNPRMVLFPREVHISASMKKFLKKNPFQLTMDEQFREVMESCGAPRRKEPRTWILPEMVEAYVRLHQLGFAHSVEVREPGQGRLVGGLYGVSIGRCFFGESMFSIAQNASKFALICLCRILEKLKFFVIDCQVSSDHLQTLGCRNIPRHKYLNILAKNIKHESLVGSWKELPILLTQH